MNLRDIKIALQKALVDYDKETILGILQDEYHGWGNECEILNEVDIDICKKILKTIQ